MLTKAKKASDTYEFEKVAELLRVLKILQADTTRSPRGPFHELARSPYHQIEARQLHGRPAFQERMVRERPGTEATPTYQGVGELVCIYIYMHAIMYDKIESTIICCNILLYIYIYTVLYNNDDSGCIHRTFYAWSSCGWAP